MGEAPLQSQMVTSSGEFKNDKYNGQGTYKFADGRKYIGSFKDDKCNGDGIEYHADGTIFREGIFEDNDFLYEQKRN